MENIIKVSSANCQGLRNLTKRTDVLNYLESSGSNIICLQETHWIDRDLSSIKNIWRGDCFINGTKTNSRGVAILIKPNFEYKIEEVISNNEGNLIIIDFLLNDTSFRLINAYAPNTDSPEYFSEIESHIADTKMQHIILCGDLNLTLNPSLDNENYKHINNPCARNKLLDLMEKHQLCDIYRKLNPDTKRYTWRRKNPKKQARLDYFITTNTLTDMIKDCQIKPGYRSDHSIVELAIIICKFQQGKGVWKFNCSLLKDKDYMVKINNAIDEEQLKYSINDPKEKMQNVISHSLFLEVLLLRLRGETIKYSTTQKKLNISKENSLMKQIEDLERKNDQNLDFEIDSKKRELEKLREEKMNGIRIRSRVKWLKEGEKPTKYFCNMEKFNYTEKTIRRLNKGNGKIIFDQRSILEETGAFYKRLFAKQTGSKENEFIKKISQYKLPKLNFEETTALEGELKLCEISQALKNMKNDKSPGIDGFPAEFYKVFWGKLEFIILYALNESCDKGIFSTSLRHRIISCLPKGNKPREFIKNWRPITLLSVLYKIASAAIANRLKSVLNKLISNNQTGFLKGRNISDCTRLVYDVMHYTENKNIPGLLLLVDFEKAFDSISWSFLNRCLNQLGFGTSFIRWITLFNTEVFASVLQCGFLSSRIEIKRGCRQGDPIAPYLFIICSQILTILIDQDEKVKGLKIANKEIKIVQFADDTTIFLDGSENSLRHTLNILEIYGNYSGLKMNKEKSELVWIGKEKNSQKKLCNDVKLAWGSTEFKLLGITFVTNLNQMPEKNYEPILGKITKTIKSWSNRMLTPIGKISVIKTILISKFVHHFQTLPNPPPQLIKKINKMLFEFIWDKKPDKISRTNLIQPKKHGGLDMIDLECFIKGLQINWVKKLLSNKNPLWKESESHLINCPERLLTFGSTWPRKIAKQCSNFFWKEIMRSWSEFLEKYQEQGLGPKSSCPIWYNPRISSAELFLPHWLKGNIIYVSDLLKPNGTVMSLAEIKNIYKIETNFLEHLQVKKGLQKFLHNSEYDIHKPIYPLNIKALMGHIEGSKKYRMVLTPSPKDLNSNLVKRWSQHHTCTTPLEWKKIFKICFYTIFDNNLKWFQYRIIYRILGTLSLRKKMKNSESDQCRICNASVETQEHLFVHCFHTAKLWADIKIQGANTPIGSISTNPIDILLGVWSNPNEPFAWNIIYLVTKNYIFHCAKKGKTPFLSELLHYISIIYNEQQILARTINKETLFEKQWRPIALFLSKE